MSKKHGMLEDVAAEIGFTAATAMVDWFGGFGQIYVPTEATEDHPFAKVIGMPAFKRLVAMFEGVEPTKRFVWMNNGDNRETARRDRLIACLIAAGGLGSKQIAAITGMAESSVRFSQLRVERLGILPMLLKRAGLENAAVNPMAKVQLKSQGSNSVAKAPGKGRGSNSVAKAVEKGRGYADLEEPTEDPTEDPYESPLVKPRHKRGCTKKRVGVGRRR